LFFKYRLLFIPQHSCCYGYQLTSAELWAPPHALLLLLLNELPADLLCCAAAAAAVAKTISQFEPVTMWTDPSVVEEAKQYLADAPNVTGALLLCSWHLRFTTTWDMQCSLVLCNKKSLRVSSCHGHTNHLSATVLPASELVQLHVRLHQGRMTERCAQLCPCDCACNQVHREVCHHMHSMHLFYMTMSLQAD
jgi:hypothetical protein